MAFLVGFIVLTMAIVAGAKPVSTGSQTDIAGQSAPVALDVSSDVSNNNTSSADLVLGNLSGCSQNTCPDYGTGFDLLLQQTPTSTGGTYDTWYGRVGDCSLCQRFPTGPNGCFDFSSCGRNQVICVDIYNNRAHRIWKDKYVISSCVLSRSRLEAELLQVEPKAAIIPPTVRLTAAEATL